MTNTYDITAGVFFYRVKQLQFCTMKKAEIVQKSAEVNIAEMLYVEKNFTVKAIAEKLDKHPKTIASWRDKYLWDDAKELLQGSPLELNKLLLREAINISKGGIPTFDSVALARVMKAFDYMSQKSNPTVITEVLMELDTFHSQIDPIEANKQTAIHKQFLHYKMQG
jgi:Putative ATPase subunit of terminase (gpP-like)